MKVAIYVEGITEAGFVYQLIGEKYHWDWTKVQMECLNLAPHDAANDLRDFGSVYSESYIDLYGRYLDQQNIADFIEDIQEPLDELDNTGFIRVRFAVMETEAWLLALSDVFQKIDNSLDADGLINKAGVDVNSDPQTAYFHPYAKLEDIFKSIGKKYSKHWREIKEIVFKLQWTDFETLYSSGRCQSFREFYDSVFM